VFSTPVGRVRAVGMVEGVSFLLLMFVAMPIKYAPPQGSELAELGKQIVFWVGLVHGLLFIAYAAVTFVAWGKGALTAKLVGLAALASLLPFGPFVIDSKLKAHEQTAKPQAASDSVAAQR
jgi:integral membrane protein